MKRVVITGLGMVAPTGNDYETAWQNALNCRSGVGPITLFEPKDMPVQLAGEVKGLDFSKYVDAKERNRVTRFVLLALAAAHEAMNDAGVSAEGRENRFGCSIGVGLGSLQDIEDATLTLHEKGFKRVSPFFIPYAIPNMAAGVVSMRHNLRGPNLCTTTACASGTHAVGEAYQAIQCDQADLMLCGGAEAVISPLGIASFMALKALSRANHLGPAASRPFDKDRDGFVMGEGSGLLVIEELEHAKKRGARIYAELVGYGLTGDAYHITAPPPGHDGGRRCMLAAMRMAKLNPDDIDYINAHGTSTKLNDEYEAQAMKEVLGAHAPKTSISSTKGVTGHCIGAAGGIEAVYTALAIARKVVPPTANLDDASSVEKLDYTPKIPKERRIRAALSNSFGFGGTNATIAMKAFQS